MPKLKTHKGAKARIHITGSGKLMRRKRMSSHLRRKKSASARRLFSKKLAVSDGDARRVTRLLPYGGR